MLIVLSLIYVFHIFNGVLIIRGNKSCSPVVWSQNSDHANLSSVVTENVRAKRRIDKYWIWSHFP